MHRPAMVRTRCAVPSNAVPGAHYMAARRTVRAPAGAGCAVEGLAHAGGLQPTQDIGDALVDLGEDLLGEDLLGEADDGPGDGCVHCRAQCVAKEPRPVSCPGGPMR